MGYFSVGKKVIIASVLLLGIVGWYLLVNGGDVFL